MLWFAQNSLPLRWQIQRDKGLGRHPICCDLLKIHYLCGDKYNAVLKMYIGHELWFAQNSLPLRWQIQLKRKIMNKKIVVICSKFITFAVTNTTPIYLQSIRDCCDLLKIHYLCGDKYNPRILRCWTALVVICSKFITFAVTNTTSARNGYPQRLLWFAQNSLPLRWQIQH